MSALNLRALANGITSGINPNVQAVYRASTVFTTGANLKQVPTYAPDVTIPVQVQPMSNGDLQKLDGMNVQNVISKVYLNGSAFALVRKSFKGGDIFVIGSDTFLVEKVLEDWPTWTSAALRLQDDT